MVGNFSSTEEALQSLAQNSVDVVLLDFDLGEKNSLQFLHSFRQRGFSGKILMVTAGISGADTFRVLKEGAAGVFLKHNPPAELITAINRVARGETWMDPSSLNSLVGSTATRTQTPSFPALSEREQGVLKGVFEGLTNKEIAGHLDISESYVKAVLQQLFAKTGVRTRSQLVRVALERRIE
jgi:DNA-binding NarL/FixJ family response regulator